MLYHLVCAFILTVLCSQQIAAAEDVGTGIDNGTNTAPILIISYQPFAGRGVNGSQTIGSYLADETIACHAIVHVSLPVQWGQPEAQVPILLATHQPVLAIGLGEGYPKRIAVETRAVNQRQHPDETGQKPSTNHIDANGPATQSARWAFNAEDFADSSLPVIASTNAGAYLCNNLLYCLASSNCNTIGFIHLPPQGSASNADYQQLISPVIRRLIEGNIPNTD